MFAALALLLAAVGIYGVVAYATAQWTQEIGVRMALGAEGGDILGRVPRQTVAPAGVGLAAGVGAASLLTRYLASQIYGVSRFDPTTVATEVAACWSPARRASRLDSPAALRVE